MHGYIYIISRYISDSGRWRANIRPGGSSFSRVSLTCKTLKYLLPSVFITRAKKLHRRKSWSGCKPDGRPVAPAPNMWLEISSLSQWPSQQLVYRYVWNRARSHGEGLQGIGPRTINWLELIQGPSCAVAPSFMHEVPFSKFRDTFW